ncbi:MAG: cyclodeaminase/cyclohydrolase family protein [Acidimicrobiales bacterium]
MTPETESPLRQRSFEALLADVAARTSAPGGGAVAALAVAMAASLCAMAARFSAWTLSDAEPITSRCDVLADRASALATADMEAYRALLEARRARAGEGGALAEDRIDALLRASDVPLEVAEIGAEVTEFAARLIAGGNPSLVGDAYTAALLAEAGTRAATRLVEINLASWGPSGAGRLARAAAAVERAAVARS